MLVKDREETLGHSVLGEIHFFHESKFCVKHSILTPSPSSPPHYIVCGVYAREFVWFDTNTIPVTHSIQVITRPGGSSWRSDHRSGGILRLLLFRRLLQRIPPEESSASSSAASSSFSSSTSSCPRRRALQNQELTTQLNSL